MVEKAFPPIYPHYLFAVLQFEISSLVNLIFGLFQICQIVVDSLKHQSIWQEKISI